MYCSVCYREFFFNLDKDYSCCSSLSWESMLITYMLITYMLITYTLITYMLISCHASATKYLNEATYRRKDLFQCTVSGMHSIQAREAWRPGRLPLWWHRLAACPCTHLNWGKWEPETDINVKVSLFFKLGSSPKGSLTSQNSWGPSIQIQEPAGTVLIPAGTGGSLSATTYTMAMFIFLPLERLNTSWIGK